MSTHSRALGVHSSGRYEAGRTFSVSHGATHDASWKLGSSSSAGAVHEAVVQRSSSVVESAHTPELCGVRSSAMYGDQQRYGSDSLDVQALQTAVEGLQLQTTSVSVETQVKINIEQQAQYQGSISDPNVLIDHSIPYSYHPDAHSSQGEPQAAVETQQLSMYGDRYERNQTVESGYHEEQESHGNGDDCNDGPNDYNDHDAAGNAGNDDGGHDNGGYADDYNDYCNDFDGYECGDDYGDGFDDYDDGGYADDFCDDY